MLTVLLSLEWDLGVGGEGLGDLSDSFLRRLQVPLWLTLPHAEMKLSFKSISFTPPQTHSER